ncbi:dph1, partial [Symbiodinium microadriaticum]
NKKAGNVKRVAPQRRRNQIPDDIVHNEALNSAIALLPANYNFEIHKTVWRVKSDSAKLVALQFPEGLLMYACIIADILENFADTKVVIMADVTYGACCIDDFTAKKIGADLLVHYGHSCLVPVNVTSMKVLYVFVEIAFDTSHLLACFRHSFAPEARVALMGTIQFTSAVHQVATELKADYPHLIVPQARPLSGGETLGCTSPLIPDCEALVFVADGRFHLEAAMIRNPSLQAFRYDPYGKTLTAEGYDTPRMQGMRWDAIESARGATRFGVILGTLGRQGSAQIFGRMRKLLRDRDVRDGKGGVAVKRTAVLFLMAELNPRKIASITGIDAWVQVSCPRLSIDWGKEFTQPMLTPYEFEVLLGTAEWSDVYPMDYYSGDGGTWTNHGARSKA